MIIKLFLIFLGGGIGSLARFVCSEGVYHYVGRYFPYGTLVVNVLGSLLIGFLTVLFFDRFPQSGHILLALFVTGFLGGFTTFSGFSADTFHLFYDANYLAGVVNIVLSVALCLLATLIGFWIAKLVV